VLDANLSWEGYAAGSTDASTIYVGDFYDPNGDKQIGAVLIMQISADCSVSQETTANLPSKVASEWAPPQVQILQLLFKDYDGNGADTADALAWRNQYQANWAVGADPNFTLAQAGTNPLPIQLLVDPRSLVIVKRTNGLVESFPEVTELAQKNAP